MIGLSSAATRAVRQPTGNGETRLSSIGAEDRAGNTAVQAALGPTGSPLNIVTLDSPGEPERNARKMVTGRRRSLVSK
jgi:hypothetical protein